MADIESTSWSETAASNNITPPDGWPEGMLPSAVNNSARENMRAIKSEWNRSGPTVTSGGSANAQTLTYTSAVAALVRGQKYSFIAGFSNSGATTLAVSGLTATAVRLNNAALVGGEIVAGRTYTVMYDGTAYQLTGGAFPLNTVPNGNTGAATFTSHGVLVGQGTSAIAATAALSAGQPLVGVTSADPAGGTVLGAYGGSLVLLSTQTASSSTSLDFTTVISSTYDEYRLEIVGLTPATDNTNLLLQFGTGGTPTYQTSNYKWGQSATNSAGSLGTIASASDSSISILQNIGNASTKSANGTIKIYSPQSSSLHKAVISDAIFLDLNGVVSRYFGGGFWSDTTVVTAIRLKMSSGNIASGTVRCYGVAKS